MVPQVAVQISFHLVKRHITDVNYASVATEGLPIDGSFSD